MRAVSHRTCICLGEHCPVTTGLGFITTWGQEPTKVMKLELLSPHKTETLKRMAQGEKNPSSDARMLVTSWLMGRKKSPLRICHQALQVQGFIFLPVMFRNLKADKVKLGLRLVISLWHLEGANPEILWWAAASYRSPRILVGKALLKTYPHVTKLKAMSERKKTEDLGL